MELPVDNRSQTYATSVAILLLISTIMYFLYTVIKFDFIIYFLIFFAILWVGLVVRAFKKNDIKKILLVDKKLLIYHRSGLIDIPLKEINHISVGLNYFIDKKGLSNRYILYLTNKYVFGDKILLKYKFGGKNEPEAIKIIRDVSKI